jgi:DNA-binding NarL/FixJ family response regulator
VLRFRVDTRVVNHRAAGEAFAAREWRRAFDLYSGAADLDGEDLDRYAQCAMLLNRMDEYFAIRERAYRELLARGDRVGAALAAFWSGMQHMVDGEVAAGGGWLERAARLVEPDNTDSVPRACLGLSAAFAVAVGGDPERAAALTGEVVADGRRLGSGELVGLALHQQGLLLIEAGRTDEGLAKLDEAMLEVASGSMTPMATGIVYCGAITGCCTAYELRRMHEWTAAMTRWCDSQPQLLQFTGECRVRRAELKQLRGAWSDAIAELMPRTAIADGGDYWDGVAAYLRGNLDRLQGRFDAAEEWFAEASRLGVDPQPGLALLRLARGSVQAAAAMSRRCLAERQDDFKRVEVLAAATQILLAAGEQEQAAEAVEELTAVAARRRSPVVEGAEEQARAAVDLAAGRHDQALAHARSALRRWVEVPAPYHEAQTRILLAGACRALGDAESANREEALARQRFTDLGAVPDSARLAGPDSVLTRRELEVLALLATGATNRAIADRLVLSERTVDRHVSNIFTKLGVATRAAATAYAFERELV